MLSYEYDTDNIIALSIPHIYCLNVVVIVQETRLGVEIGILHIYYSICSVCSP